MCVCVYTYIYMHMYVHTYILCTCMCMCEPREGCLVSYSMTLFPIFFRQCLWLSLGLGYQTASQAILLSPALLALGSLVLEGPCVAFYKDSGDQIQVLGFVQKIILPTELSPASIFSMFNSCALRGRQKTYSVPLHAQQHPVLCLCTIRLSKGRSLRESESGQL